ncbi:phosphate ABC transporter permease PstA [Rathayibacter toxicus]|uniref:Phosphate transport system permease protein PstA n=1 Tax=Rathayibacter toxicus TaxID=145458 RepID=A0A0C5BDD8_9MICO|nr:phosphate ABC transporter permease PstA [Rathayibacter toxicus]AJM77236.1 phosphate ABC transporter permease [Rathayibacter toxicus]ALS56904.1 phosphate ABC transporter permease [Rathayibacter toxicus]KKM46260.1 phosphate ABC transporter permease [Rathayibacter toxicus]PPG23223.1 phosphate ABC transporter permease PtsA [Rathayibacter toxicus]PPG47807.1 phosphate ABC transporter permease PtsA [Rathayibacter toxicus]
MPVIPSVNIETGTLPTKVPWLLLIGSWVTVALVFLVFQAAGMAHDFSLVGTIFWGTILFDLALSVVSRLVEGRRRATDRLVTSLVSTAFIIALLPLVSLLSTVLSNGLSRFDPLFFESSMRNVTGPGGGALHAIVGTLEITAMATLISVPIALLTSIYLVEYGSGHLARAITFLVDVMTGIPSIVAGLFAYALFALIFGPGVRMGFAGSVALAVLMIPVVVRSSEEMLKLVPNELREASYALGVPKWLTILKIVLPTSIAGITTGITLAIARVIGETAPLLIVAGFTASMNYDLFTERMMTLPVFVYTQYANQGPDAEAFLHRAWTGAMVLILMVMMLNLAARLIAKIFSPKLGR